MPKTVIIRMPGAPASLEDEVRRVVSELLSYAEFEIETRDGDVEVFSTVTTTRECVQGALMEEDVVAVVFTFPQLHRDELGRIDSLLNTASASWFEGGAAPEELRNAPVSSMRSLHTGIAIYGIGNQSDENRPEE